MIRFSLLFTLVLSLDTLLAPLKRGIRLCKKSCFGYYSKMYFLNTNGFTFLTPLLRGAGGVFLFFTNFPFKPKKSPCYSLTPIGAASFFSPFGGKKDIADSGTMFPDKPFVTVPK